MTDLQERYDLFAAAAWVRGHARRTGIPQLPEALLSKQAPDCSDAELEQITLAGQDAGLKLYPFKTGTQTLARTRRTLGFLHSIAFETMLDVGSGRGVFLIPFMKEFPWVQVTGLDLLEKRVTFLSELAQGGFPRLRALQEDICRQPFADNSFDVITMLEVLEHIPEVEKAMFSLGFVLNENLKQNDRALEVLGDFQKRFPKSELKESVDWLVENIKSDGKLADDLMKKIEAEE